jgi:Lon protease-like protein
MTNEWNERIEEFQPMAMRSDTYMPIFPLGVVLLPHMPMPLHIFEERYKLMITECLDQRQDFGLIYVKESNIQRIGCSARITDVLKRYKDGRMDILTVGGNRFLITSIDESRPFLQGSVLYFDDEIEKPAQDLLRKSIRALELLEKLNRLAGTDADDAPPAGADLSLLSFFIASHEGFTFDERQELLEMTSPAARIEREVELLVKKIDVLHAREEIRKITGGNGKMRKV